VDVCVREIHQDQNKMQWADVNTQRKGEDTDRRTDRQKSCSEVSTPKSSPQNWPIRARLGKPANGNVDRGQWDQIGRFVSIRTTLWSLLGQSWVISRWSSLLSNSESL